MKKWTGVFLYFSAVSLVALFVVCFFLAPALSQEQEDVYIEGDQSHFKLEKGKRYHGKWTKEKSSTEKPPQPPQPGMSKEQATEPPPPTEEPGPEPGPVQEQMPAPEAEKEKPAESAVYEKLQRAIQPEEGADSSSQASSGAGPAAGLEISDRPGVLSCKYMGIVNIKVGIDKDEDKRVVQLLFTNNTDKDIQGIWGGFRIKDATGSSIYATGVTDTASIIKPGGDRPFNLFSYSKIKEEVENALKGASGKVELVFGVDSVGFTDGSKIEF